MSGEGVAVCWACHSVVASQAMSATWNCSLHEWTDIRLRSLRRLHGVRCVNPETPDWIRVPRDNINARLLQLLPLPVTSHNVALQGSFHPCLSAEHRRRRSRRGSEKRKGTATTGKCLERIINSLLGMGGGKAKVWRLGPILASQTYTQHASAFKSTASAHLSLERSRRGARPPVICNHSNLIFTPPLSQGPAGIAWEPAWGSVPLEKLSVAQLLKNCPRF
jgi:hypothetical protein